MKKRLHDKKADIAILAVIIIISLAEAVFTISNLSEQLAVIVFAAIILFFCAKVKDRICYLLYGAW